MRYEELDIHSVILDVENPRIAKFIEIYKEIPSEEHLFLALGVNSPNEESSGTTFRSLQEAIRTNGKIIHPIIVNKKEGKHVVIEGNTRVAIYRKFQSENVKGNWDKIPAIVYEDLDQGNVDAIRLQAHLVGPRAWDPYSKAKYLNKLRNEKYLTIEQLVEYCGGKRGDIENYLYAYEDMEKYYREIINNDADFDVTRFSAFVELQKRNIKNSILEAGKDFYDFAHWVNDHLIDPLNTVRKIPFILKDKEATKIFLKKGARAAIKELEKEDQTDGVQIDSANIDTLANKLAEKINMLSWSEVKKIKEDPDCKIAQALLDVKDELVSFCESELEE